MSRMMEYILNILITLDCPLDWVDNLEDEEQIEALPGDQQTLAWGLILYLIAEMLWLNNRTTFLMIQIFQ